MNLLDILITAAIWVLVCGVALGVILFGLFMLASVVAERAIINRPPEREVPPLTEADIRKRVREIQKAGYDRTCENARTIRKVMSERVDD